MKIKNLIIFIAVIIFIISSTGCINKPKSIEKFSLYKYDLINEYFIYIDNNNHINKVSYHYDNIVSSIYVKIIQSDEEYVEKISYSSFNPPTYTLYVNLNSTNVSGD